jgi:hypothetical protein
MTLEALYQEVKKMRNDAANPNRTLVALEIDEDLYTFEVHIKMQKNARGGTVIITNTF